MSDFLFESSRYRTLGRNRLKLTNDGERSLEAVHTRLREHSDSLETPCPCGVQDDRVITGTDRNGLPYRLVLCTSCGLMRMDPRPRPEELLWFYTNHYRSLYGDEPGPGLIEGKLWKGKLVVRALQRAGVELPDGPALDIGCGGGWTLRPFVGQRECIGYDYDDRILDFGRIHDLTLRHGGVEEALGDGVRAALLICGHVLEHVPDPVGHLCEMRPLLACGGYFYLEVPHTPRIGNRLRGDGLRYWQRAHLWEFQQEHLVAFARAAGYEVVWDDIDAVSAFVLCRGGKGEQQPLKLPRLGDRVRAELLRYEAARLRPGLVGKLRNLWESSPFGSG